MNRQKAVLPVPDTIPESLPEDWQQQAPPAPLDPFAVPAAGRWQGNLETLATVLGNRARWVALRELGLHGRLPVAWLAMRAGVSAQVMSQHMSVLKKAGLVVPSVGRLYQLHASLMPARDVQHIDLGYAVIRLPPRR